MEIKYRSVISNGWKAGEVDHKGIEAKRFWGDVSVLYLNCSGVYMTVYICQNVKKSRTIHQKA